MTAYDKALYLLGMREHGRRELEIKLIGKGYDEGARKKGAGDQAHRQGL